MNIDEAAHHLMTASWNPTAKDPLGRGGFSSPPVDLLVDLLEALDHCEHTLELHVVVPEAAPRAVQVLVAVTHWLEELGQVEQSQVMAWLQARFMGNDGSERGRSNT